MDILAFGVMRLCCLSNENEMDMEGLFLKLLELSIIANPKIPVTSNTN